MKKEEIGKFTIKAESMIVEAMQKIDINANGLLFVLDEKEKLAGVITDGDIRRWIIKTGKIADTSVDRVMNPNPKVIYTKDVALAGEFMEKYRITALPVLTLKNRISDIILKNQKMEEDISSKDSLKDIPVVIMAAGKGTRLYPYTKILPKPLIPIGEIPIMERIINEFLEFGSKEFIITVNYKRGMIKSYFAELNPDYNIKYVVEDKPLGTCGSIRLIEEKFDKPFFVTNCDILIHADYEDIYKRHQESGNEITMVTAAKNIQVPYGVINSSEDGQIIAMEEKPKLTYFVNTGMYVLNSNLVEEIPEDTFYHMTDLVNKLMSEGRKVGIYPISEEAFLDMGELEEMERMERKLNLR